jgi:hypothetical protein
MRYKFTYRDDLDYEKFQEDLSETSFYSIIFFWDCTRQLDAEETPLVESVLRRHPRVDGAIIF